MRLSITMAPNSQLSEYRRVRIFRYIASREPPPSLTFFVRSKPGVTKSSICGQLTL